MPDPQTLFLALIFLINAFLYATVGQAGGTGYLAAMALVGLAPQIMKPTALILNILVAAIASYSYLHAGCFSWKRFWPFVTTSIPFAFLGGSLNVPILLYRWVIGVVLIFTAFRLLIHDKQRNKNFHPFSIPTALVIGAIIGLLAGITGIGGGIFLAPVLILMAWADFSKVKGISAMFILVNSISGLAGSLTSMRYIPVEIPYWLIAVSIGGIAGTAFGRQHLNSLLLMRLLAVVLIIGGLKIIFV